MNIYPIRTQADYQNARQRVSVLVDLDPVPGSQHGDELEILGTLLEAYEAQHYPIDLPDPIEAIRFRMEQQGLKAKDLQPMLGGLNRVYEVLNRKRPLSLAMVRRLHEGLGISAACLIRDTGPMAQLIGGWPQFICDKARYNLGSHFLQDLPEESLKWVGRVPKTKAPAWGNDFSSFTPERIRQDAWPDPQPRSDGWQKGQLVFHAKFGQGTILALEGKDNDARAQINFNRHGVKWLALAVAKLTAVE